MGHVLHGRATTTKQFVGQCKIVTLRFLSVSFGQKPAGLALLSSAVAQSGRAQNARATNHFLLKGSLDIEAKEVAHECT